MMSAHSEYRPEIDGLRAVAVLIVLLFHASPSIMPGGFVGVDVFFVISGYLISRNIIDDIRAGRFSVRRFYERRARRILPAFMATIVLCFVASLVIFSPSHLKQFSISAIYAAFSAANIFFWQQSGYFDDAAAFKPLLHFWSLSVEEQFYLIWPITLFVVLRYLPRSLCAILLALGFASLIASHRFMSHDPAAAFYLTPFRMWELALGALCLFLPENALKGKWTNEAAMGGGLLMIVVCALAYSRNTAFPGVAALPPCIGASLVLCSRKARCGFLLRNRIAVGLGLISYSLYLVHWPVLVFYRYWTFSPLSTMDLFGLIVASIAAATIMYLTIEQPFRRQKRPYKLSSRSLVAVAAVVSAITIIPSYFAWTNDGWAWRLQGTAKLYWRQVGDPTNGFRCNKPVYWNGITWICEFGVPVTGRVDAILLGDSYAWHWVSGMDALFRANGLSGVYLGSGGSLPFKGGMRYDGRVPLPGVLKTNEGFDRYIIKQRPPVVILSARWSIHALTFREPGEEGPRKFFTYKGFKNLTANDSAAAVREALFDTIEEYRENHIHTILLGQVPYPGPEAAECLARANWIIQFKTGQSCQQFGKAQSLKSPLATNGLLTAAGDSFPIDVSVYLLSAPMCDGKQNCDFVDSGGSFYWQNGHLSRYGSIALARRYLQPVVSTIKRIESEK